MRSYVKEHYKNLLLLSIIGIVIMLFLGQDRTLQGHDMKFHVSNIRNLATEINPLQGKFFAPDISENIANNLGYGLYIFYPSLPHLVYAYGYKIVSLFHGSVLDSIFVINILVTLLATYFMYALSYRISKNKKIAFFTGIIFLLFPYRLASIFVRYSINEAFTYLWIPLILLGLLDLKDHNYKRFYIYFIIGYIGLLFSHLLIALYFTLLLIPYVIIYRKEIFDKKTIFTILKATIFVSLFALPSIVQMLQHQNQYYLVFAEGIMTSRDLVMEQGLHLSSYLFLDRDAWHVPLFIPIMVIILFFISTFILVKNHKKEKEGKFYTVLLCITVLAFVMTLKIFPWKYMPSFFLMIQFPWRLETMLVVTVSLIAPYFLTKLKVKYIMLPFTILLILNLSSYMMWMVNRQYHVSEKDIDDTYAVGNSSEYYPVEYSLSKEYYEKRTQDIILIGGSADIKVEKSTFPNIKFIVRNSKDAVVELPRIYYLGYELMINGKPYELTRSNRGLLRQRLIEDGTYEITYKGTLAKQILVGMREISLLLVIVYFIRKKGKGENDRVE